MLLPKKFIALSCLLFGICIFPILGESYSSAIKTKQTRTWLGPEFWANRLQDWRLSQGRIECVNEKKFRTCHLLTRRIGDSRGNVTIKVKTGPLWKNNGSSGILIGAGASDLDYRAASMVMGYKGPESGLYAGINHEGIIFIEDFSNVRTPVYSEDAVSETDVQLELLVIPGWFRYKLNLRAVSLKTGKLVSEVFMNGVRKDSLTGNLALVSDERSSWFKDWEVSGSKLLTFHDRHAGPVFSSRFTLNQKNLTLSVQMMPLGKHDDYKISMQVKHGEVWSKIKETRISPRTYQAVFNFKNWKYEESVPYRIVYNLGNDKKSKQYLWEGMIRSNPISQDELKVVSLHGQKIHRPISENETFKWDRDHVWFPYVKLNRHIKKHNPDLLFFPGDQSQVFEPEFHNVRTARLDYLYRWYLTNWAFRDLTKDRPSVSSLDLTSVEDSHDYFNLLDNPSLDVVKQQRIQFTLKRMLGNQMSHMPKAVQGLQTFHRLNGYDTSLVYGRVGFAVFDRNPQLQSNEAFLSQWSKHWEGQDMKVALSTYPLNDMVTHSSRLSKELDKNRTYRWNSEQRDAILGQLRQAQAVSIHGYPSFTNIIQQGQEQFSDSVYSFTTPSISPLRLDSWQVLKDETSEAPTFNAIGEHVDLLDNKMTVHSIAQAPVLSEEKSMLIEEALNLEEMGAGYGVMKLDKIRRSITFEAWPLYTDPQSRRGVRMLKSFPVSIRQEDNDGREAVAYLPRIEVHGLNNPVIQIIDEENQEVLYTVRMKNNQLNPKVFRKGSYTIIIGGHDYLEKRILTNIQTIDEGEEDKVMTVMLGDSEPIHQLSDK